MQLRPSVFSGRDDEWSKLDAALERAEKFRAPQFVTLVGTLGMGRSRLLEEWLADVDARHGRRTVLLRLPEPGPREPEPYGVVTAYLRARFGLDEGLDVAEVEKRLRAELQRVFADRRVAEIAALLGRYLGLELEESPLSRVLRVSPEHEDDLARTVFCRFLEEDAALQPLVIAIDDLHRADDRSLDFLARLPGEIDEAPFLMVVTGRPDLLVRRPEWGRGEGSQVRVDLGPLGRRELDAMLRSMLGAGNLVPGLLERAIVESGGNPFLLEELLRTYLQHGILAMETGEDWWFDVERAEQESMALTPEESAPRRVAALSAIDRDLLTRAAAFGPRFWAGGVVALGRLAVEPQEGSDVFVPDPSIVEVRRTLDDLAERLYLVRLPEPTLFGETEWAFRQPLERDLVAGAVDPAVMARRKRFAAQWLETRLGDRLDEHLELLGTLYEEGGDGRRGARFLLAAADKARTHLAWEKARALFLRGLRLLDLDDAIAKIDALHSVGDVAARLGRSREALAHFGEMLRLAWRLDLPAKGGAAHDRIGRLYRASAQYPEALRHLELARQLFDLAGDLRGIASALDDIGRVHLLVGNPEASMRFHRAALAVREEVGDDRAKALTLAWMGEVEHVLGDLASAENHYRQALELRRRVGDRPGVVTSLLDLGGIERDHGRHQKAVAILEEARALARELGEKLFECYVGIAMGDCWLSEQKPAEALFEFEQAKDIAQRFGARRLVADASRGTAEATLALGDPVAARDQARVSLEIAHATGNPHLEGAALRVLAAAVAVGAPGDADLGGAREMFDRAVEILGDAGAELELGRALTAYADFEDRTGRGEAARGLREQAEAIRLRARSSPRLPVVRPPQASV